MSRLITTALWENINDDEEVILLGEWCRIYASGDAVRKNAPVLNYHWDDREKAANDYKYLYELSTRLIPLLAKQLNDLHGTRFSNCAWQLMIGNWLSQFLAVTFDRWEMLCLAQSMHSSLFSYVSEESQDLYIPHDSIQAGNQFYEDRWNHIFIGGLMNHFPSIQVIKKSNIIIPTTAAKERGGKKLRLSQFKVQIKRILLDFFAFFLKPRGKSNTDYVLVSNGLNFSNLCSLRFKLCGSFHYEPRFPVVPLVQYDGNMRQWKLSSWESETQFEKVVKDSIPLWIPRSYVEGFTPLRKSIGSAKLPYHPDVIFTSGSHFSDDAFKIWAASRWDEGCKLVVGQHGGGPFHRYNGSTQFDLDVADIYVTTGNGNRGYPNLQGVGQYWSRLKYGDWDDHGIALVVTVAMPRYFFDLRSMALAGQMLCYFEDQFTFFGTLPARIQKQALIRLYPADYGWNQKLRWLDRFDTVKIAESSTSITQLAKKVRIFISTYNATTYNESLAANIPTVIYWDSNYWESAEWAKEDFDGLKTVGIFHETPESAAKHVEAIWDDVANWWFDSELQAVREHFCESYAYRDPSVISKLANVLREAGGE